MVDPQLQAIHWLKGMYKDKVDVVRLSSVDLLRKMSTAIKEGRTIIIENMLEDGPDAALMPVIARQIKVRVDCTQVVHRLYRLGVVLVVSLPVPAIL